MSLEAYLGHVVREEVRRAVADLRESKPAAGEGPAFLTLASAAARAEVSKSTVRNWVRAGRLRLYGPGRVKRVKRAELDALLEAGDVGDAAPSVQQRADALVLELARGRAADREG